MNKKIVSVLITVLLLVPVLYGCSTSDALAREYNHGYKDGYEKGLEKGRKEAAPPVVSVSDWKSSSGYIEALDGLTDIEAIADAYPDYTPEEMATEIMRICERTREYMELNQ